MVQMIFFHFLDLKKKKKKKPWQVLVQKAEQILFRISTTRGLRVLVFGLLFCRSLADLQRCVSL